MPRESKGDVAWRHRVDKATAALLESGRAVRYGAEGEEHFCRPDELLVASSSSADLVKDLDELGATPDDLDLELGVTRYLLPAGTDVHAAVLQLRKTAGTAAAAAPNALLFGVPKVRGCPGRPAVPPAAGLSLAEGPGGEGVLIAVVDTGQSEGSLALDWMSTHVTVDTSDLDLLDGDGDGRLDLEAGHGTFISGVIAQVAPGANVLALKALDPAGVTDDLTAAARVRDAMSSGAQIVNLSFGGYTHSDEGLLALEHVLYDKEVVVVAAAGNDAVDRPFFPAAHPAVIAVAALGTRKRRAAFSNFGKWVDACAEGERLLSTFVVGTVTTDSDGDGREDEFVEPAALWSGTSFAAPQVAAAIAVRMSEHGESAVDAARAVVRDPGLPRRTGIGVHVVTPLRGRPAR